MSRKFKTILVMTLVLTFVLSWMGMPEAEAVEPVREETVIYTGVTWAPPTNWNPLYHDPQAGTIGLMYEPMFHFDPHAGEWTPWLAEEEGEWIEDDVFYVQLREEPTFHDGEPLTAHDVVFTFDLAEEVDLYYSHIWAYLDEVVAVSDTEVEFHFENPNYQQWQTFLYDQPIVPEHIWDDVDREDIADIANEDPVGSGPFTYGEALEDRMIWERVDDWWGNDIHGEPAPRFIEDVIVYENSIALGMILQGELDISNNFLPGTPELVRAPDYDIVTYYEDEPFHLSGNTGLLYLNTDSPGLDDPLFRRALAFAIDYEDMIDRVYQGAALEADPSGLFGAWAEYRSEEVVEEWGFEYDPAQAEALLEEGGYVDSTGDGWRNTPDGEEIELELQVPAGWSDWEDIMRIIDEYAREIGIRTEPNFADDTVYNNNMWNADFDIVFNDYETQISGTPYTYFEAVAYDGIDAETVTQGNFGRYENEELFDLITEFNMTPPESDEAYEIAADIQEILLKDMPVIPVMLNPTYSQALENYWTNWPSEDNPHGVAVGWGGLWQMGGLETILNLEPAQ